MTLIQLRRYKRELVEQQGWTPGTDLENRVAFLLAKWGHGPDVLTQQHRIGRYRVDFAHVAKKIAIEADGWWHRSPEGAARDARRDSYLRSQGWLVLRVDDHHGDESLIKQVAAISRLLHTLRDDDGWPLS